ARGRVNVVARITEVDRNGIAEQDRSAPVRVIAVGGDQRAGRVGHGADRAEVVAVVVASRTFSAFAVTVVACDGAGETVCLGAQGHTAVDEPMVLSEATADAVLDEDAPAEGI